MTLEFTAVNWIAVIAAAVAGVVIGFVWYLPMVFGTRWAASAGRELPTGSVSPVVYVGSIVQALVTAYVLALFIGALGATGVINGLVVGFVAWIGFVATVTINSVLYEGRSVEYWLITAGFSLVSLLTMGAIIGALGA